MTRTAIAATTVAVIALVACSSGGSSRPVGSPRSAPPASECAEPGLPTTVAYATPVGVDPDLTSLDIHSPARACDAPVVMWVHGGGYHRGDKANHVEAKARLFNDEGWLFVSVNYRLTRPGTPGSAQFPDHYDDVAAAAAWARANIAGYGGDPARIALLGHSAGADIVANVAVNPRYLEAQGLDLSAITCAGPLDTEGFDKEAATAAGSGAEQTQWSAALGNNPSYLTETSATVLIRPDVGIPPMIGVVRGTPRRQQIETDFLDRLRAAGVAATAIDARPLTHAQVNNQIGAPGDTVMTAPLVAFLRECLEA